MATSSRIVCSRLLASSSRYSCEPQVVSVLFVQWQYRYFVPVVMVPIS